MYVQTSDQLKRGGSIKSLKYLLNHSVDGDIVILEETTLIRMEILLHRIKMIN